MIFTTYNRAAARFIAVFTALTMIAAAFPFQVLVAQAARAAELPSGVLDANVQVDVCHNNNGVSDYSLVQAKASAIVNGENSGHPETKAVHEDDIIPPFDYDFGNASGTYPGRNWDSEGEEIFLNDCAVPPPPPARCPIGENLLKNGSFEEPVADENAAQGGFWEVFDAIPNWVSSTGDFELWNNMFGGASHGQQNAELDVDAGSEITQTVTTLPGGTYELRFDFSPRPGTALEDNDVDALVNGSPIKNANGDGSNLNETDWTTYTETFVATGASTDISFIDNGTSNGKGSLIDNTVLCLVEEPEEEIENSCIIPDTLGDTEDFGLGDTPDDEKPLPEIFDDYGYGSVDAEEDETNYQVWDLEDADTDSVTFEVTVLGYEALNRQLFGYYEKGNPGSFVPLFKVGSTHSAAVPAVAVGGTFMVTIPADAAPFGFAIDTENNSGNTKWFSEFALNTKGEDNLGVYNPEENVYLLAFEDYSVAQNSDNDHNDLVLKIDEVACHESESYQCDAGLLYLDTETNDPSFSTLHTVDETDGSATAFADYDLSLFPVLAVAHDETVYSIDKTTGDLVTLDDDSGAYTVVGNTGIKDKKPVAMEFAPDGTLYVLTENNDALYEVHTGNGVATKLHDLDLDVSGGDVVFEGRQIVYVRNEGQVYGIDDASYDETLLGTLSVGAKRITSAATKDGTHYAYTREDSFHPFTLNPFVEGAILLDTGPFAWGDGSFCPAEPVRECVVDIVSDEEDYVVEKDAYAKALSFIHNAWTAVIGGATWIWGDDPVVDPTQDETQTFEKKFGFEGNVTKATLYVASDNSHEAEINSSPAGSALEEKNFSLADQDEYDVTGLINQGNNELSIAVKNWAGNANPEHNPAGLLYKLHIEGTVTNDEDCEVPYEEGRGQLIVQKVVEGGDLDPDDFYFKVDDNSPEQFEADGENVLVLPEGEYDIVEVDVPKDYSVSYQGCEEVEVDADAKDAPVCVITNTYNPPLVCEPGVNLVANGGFEDPKVTHAKKWDIFDLTSYPALAWAVEFVSGFAGAPDEASLELQAGVNGWTPSEGEQYAELDSDWGGPDDPQTGEEASVKISQTIPTIPGEEYTLSWDFSPRPNTSQPENDLEVFVEGAKIANNTGAGAGVNVWTPDSYTFVATDDETTIAFADDGDPNAAGTFVDNVSLVCNPEPEAGPYCGDGEINQSWEQCEVGEKGCTDYCLWENQCHYDQLVKITLDEQAPASVSFNGNIYLGDENNPIPNGTWFKFDEVDGKTAQSVAKASDGLGVERTGSELVLAVEGDNEKKEFDYAFGTIEVLGLDMGAVDRNPVVGWPLEDTGDYIDVFKKTDNTIDFELYLTTGDDAASVELDALDEPYDCPLDEEELSCSISASQVFVAPGTDVELIWNTNLADYAEIDQSVGSVGLYGTTTVTVDTDTTYTLTAYQNYGALDESSVTCDVLVEVDQGGGGGGGGLLRSTGGSGGDNDGDGEPDGIVAGEQVSVIPLGAADTGAGGASPVSVPASRAITSLFGMAIRVVRNER